MSKRKILDDSAITTFTEARKDTANLVNQGASLSNVTVATMQKAAAKIDPVSWAMAYRKIRGRSYNFVITESERKNTLLWRFHRPFLQQELADLRKVKVDEKARQVGCSENRVTEELWFLDNHPSSKVVHTFPRDAQMADFVNSRVDPALEETPYLKNLIREPNSNHLKRIGDAFFFFRSSWSEALGEGVDADMVTFDEKDRMKVGVEFAFKESLSASPYGYERYVSTPTIPNRGVDVYYQQSDKHEWYVRCDNCGTWQTLSYPENFQQLIDYPPHLKKIPENSWRYVCRKCKEPRLDRWKGVWNPTAKSDVAGYHFTQAMCVWISATDIMQKKVDFKHKNIWYNYVLGLPYRDDDELVSTTDFENCFLRNPDWKMCKFRPNGITRVSVGIDWGDISWYVIKGQDSNGRTYILDIGIIPKADEALADAKEMATRIRNFQPDIIVADTGYGKDSNKLFSKVFTGIFYGCSFPRSPTGSRIINPVWSDTGGKVNADKTLMLKSACLRYKDFEHTVVPDVYNNEEMKMLITHYGNLVLSIEEDVRPDKSIIEYEQVSSAGDDHLALADGYCEMGLTRYETTDTAFGFEFI